MERFTFKYDVSAIPATGHDGGILHVDKKEREYWAWSVE